TVATSALMPAVYRRVRKAPPPRSAGSGWRRCRTEPMRAIQVSEHGGPEVLTYTEVPDPQIGPGQLLVDTDAIGVNFIDTYIRTGTYKQPVPYIPGAEG